MEKKNMNMKKILAIAILVLAVISCMNVASAGFFDFLTGNSQPETEMYKFDGFSLELPKDSTAVENQTNVAGIHVKSSILTSKAANSTLYVASLTGDNLVSSADEYVNIWVAEGASDAGKYKDWSVADLSTVKDQNTTYGKFMLVKHDGSQIVLLEGDNLTSLKNIADTYKKA